jgi:tetratricopeptide (TPR) repeat protein/serine phosphatase RsbU (regulator of sigma subunit)
MKKNYFNLMQKNLKYLLLFLSVVGFFNKFQAKKNLDSLFGVWQDVTQPDSNRLSALHKFIWKGYLFSQPDSAFFYAQMEYDFAEENGNERGMVAALNTQGISFAIKGDYELAVEYFTKLLKVTEKLGDKKGVATAYNNIGNIYKDQGDFDNAIANYSLSLEIRTEIKDEKGIAASYNNIGLICEKQGDYAKAIEYHTNSLKIKEKIDNKKGIADSYLHIGLIYEDQGDYSRAMEYYQNSLSIQKKIEDIDGMGYSYGNIGTIYSKKGQAHIDTCNCSDDKGYYAKSLESYQKGLQIKEESGDKRGIAIAYNNIGAIDQLRQDYKRAIIEHTRALKIFEEIGAQEGMVSSYNYLGVTYLKSGNYSKAELYSNTALKLAEEIGSLTEMKYAATYLWENYKKTGKYKKALEMHELYISTRDSLSSEENSRALIQQEFKYNYEKQSLADSLAFEQKEQLKEIEHQNELVDEANQRYALYGGVIFLILLAGVAFRGYNRKKRDNVLITSQKEEVELQKLQVEEAHKEIRDSINYAERIQRSFLATDDLLNNSLKDYFVFFQPKDVVSGDFYWATKLTNNNFAIVTADSTGHGVPGAIMSILNISSLEKAIDKKLLKPAEIFNHTRDTIINRLSNDGSKDGGKDGMDASIISFDFDNNKFSYAAAQNPIWIIRKGELIEIKPEKMPVGKHHHDAVPFVGGEFEMEKGDVVYTITDGFQDQFGGIKGKKFKVKPFKEFLISIVDLPMVEQREKIQQTFTDWKGNEEQVDDVCVIGVRI